MTAGRITRILVPIDFGATSKNALVYGRMLASTFGASLHLVHVMDDMLTSRAFGIEGFGAIPAGVDEGCQVDAGTRLANLLSREEATRFHATCAVVFGTTAESITRYAAEHDIDLIAMGTRGRSGVAHAVLGSVTERVVRTAKCPVLTVRESGAVKLRNLQRERISVPLSAHA